MICTSCFTFQWFSLCSVICYILLIFLIVCDLYHFSYLCFPLFSVCFRLCLFIFCIFWIFLSVLRWSALSSSSLCVWLSYFLLSTIVLITFLFFIVCDALNFMLFSSRSEFFCDFLTLYVFCDVLVFLSFAAFSPIFCMISMLMIFCIVWIYCDFRYGLYFRLVLLYARNFLCFSCLYFSVLFFMILCVWDVRHVLHFRRLSHMLLLFLSLSTFSMTFGIICLFVALSAMVLIWSFCDCHNFWDCLYVLQFLWISLCSVIGSIFVVLFDLLMFCMCLIWLSFFDVCVFVCSHYDLTSDIIIIIICILGLFLRSNYDHDMIITIIK